MLRLFVRIVLRSQNSIAACVAGNRFMDSGQCNIMTDAEPLALGAFVAKNMMRKLFNVSQMPRIYRNEKNNINISVILKSKRLYS